LANVLLGRQKKPSMVLQASFSPPVLASSTLVKAV